MGIYMGIYSWQVCHSHHHPLACVISPLNPTTPGRTAQFARILKLPCLTSPCFNITGNEGSTSIFLTMTVTWTQSCFYACCLLNGYVWDSNFEATSSMDVVWISVTSQAKARMTLVPISSSRPSTVIEIHTTSGKLTWTHDIKDFCLDVQTIIPRAIKTRNIEVSCNSP